MQQFINIASFKKSFIVFMACLYLFNPLKNSILEVAHELSHALEMTINAPHSHSHDEENVVAHHHDHAFITFFSNIFSSEEDGNYAHDIASKIEFDKHFGQEDYAVEFFPKPIKKQFISPTSATCLAFLKQLSPPPET